MKPRSEDQDLNRFEADPTQYFVLILGHLALQDEINVALQVRGLRSSFLSKRKTS